ncbi:MAG TPA: hypothetical protein VIH49_05370 [Solirubrobacteraceae bacterium]
MERDDEPDDAPDDEPGRRRRDGDAPGTESVIVMSGATFSSASGQLPSAS